MSPTARETLDRLYAAFTRLDGAAMAACYAEDAEFRDPVFHLRGRDEVGAMWGMLCEQVRAGGLQHWRLSVRDHGHSQMRVEVEYPYAPTGRVVHNFIHSQFEFDAQGLVLRQVDRFGLWRWTRQALGWRGTLLGWTPWVRRRVRQGAAAALRRYRQRDPGPAEPGTQTTGAPGT